MRTWMIVLLLLGITPATWAQAPRVQATLLADTNALTPGRTFRLGVLLAIAPGWHIYWRNPGDAGAPTNIAFQLPPGFTAEPLLWPVPKAIRDSDEVETYGYEDKVLLWTRVHVPSDLPLGSDMTLRAQARWLVCRAVCVPGQAEVSLPLVVMAQAGPDNTQVFARWAGQTPVDSAAPQSPVRVQRTGAIAPGATQSPFTLTLAWLTPGREQRVFFAPDPAVSIQDVTTTHENRTTRIAFTARVFAGQKPATPTLLVVVAYTDAAGARRGVSIPVDLFVKPPSP